GLRKKRNAAPPDAVAARSVRPSPSKSPAAMPHGLAPAGYVTAAANAIVAAGAIASAPDPLGASAPPSGVAADSSGRSSAKSKHPGASVSASDVASGDTPRI